jgi:hypothetical protein
MINIASATIVGKRNCIVMDRVICFSNGSFAMTPIKNNTASGVSAVNKKTNNPTDCTVMCFINFADTKIAITGDKECNHGFIAACDKNTKVNISTNIKTE